MPINIQQQTKPLWSLQSIFDRGWNDFYNEFELSKTGMREFEALVINPSIDIVEDKDVFKVEVEMPGIDENDIKLSINEGMLTIRAEKHVSKKDKGKNYIMREIGYGNYERSIALPEYLDIEQAKASFKKGMLWITIPKKSEYAKKSRELKVEKVQE